jgi:hypothetical protein
MSGADDTVWRTHPVVYGCTFVADGIGAIGVVEVTQGSGMTLGNSIVLSSGIRPFGIRVSGCSPAMEAGACTRSHFRST